MLDVKIREKGISALICILGLILITGSIIAVKYSQNVNIDKRVEFLNETDRKKYYIDFAMNNRIDFIPNFEYLNLQASEVDYEIELSKELPII